MTFSKNSAKQFALMIRAKSGSRLNVPSTATFEAYRCLSTMNNSMTTNRPSDEHDILVKEYYRACQEKMSTLRGFGMQNGEVKLTAPFANPSSVHLDFAAEEEFSTLRRYAFSESYIIEENSENETGSASDLDPPHHSTSVEETTKHWVSLAALTQDPMIQTVSSHIQDESKKHLRCPFPVTIDEALQDTRPVVITSSISPYRILHVNDAWVSLCGYRREEALGKTVNELLHGPSTETFLAHELVGKQLMQDSYSHAVVTNYTKQGRKFMNFVQVSDMPSTDGKERGKEESEGKLYVAVLQEISNDGYQLEESLTMMGATSR